MSFLPNKTSEYASAEYWEERFKEEEEREWCQQFQDFRHLLEPLIKQYDQILIIGCGNSKLGQNLVQAGYCNVVNCDVSITVLQKMNQLARKQLESSKQMQWICCNMLNLPFQQNQFDVIIEKGTLDVWFTENSPWNVSPQAQQRIQKTLDNIFKNLKIGGKFISITFADPYFRMKYYDNKRYNWKSECQPFGSDFHYYFYTMTKFSDQLCTSVVFQEQQTDEKQQQYSNANNLDNFKPMHGYMDEEDYMFKISDELMD